MHTSIASSIALALYRDRSSTMMSRKDTYVCGSIELFAWSKNSWK